MAGQRTFQSPAPLERPGWLYGPGACWQLYAPRPYPIEPAPAEELEALEAYMKELRQELEGIKTRIKELKETKGKE